MVVSGLCAVLTFGGAKTWRLCRDARAGRPCSVAGTFVTQFEERLTQRTETRQAVTKINQRGLEVEGVTTELLSERSWELRGRIDRQGFLRGTYARTEAPERRIGSFVLAIDSEGENLSGLWSHYDAMSREVVGGQHSMRRCVEPN